jgi:hypothetical protein
VKQIYRNQETDEVLKHFRLRCGLILVFCNNKTLIVQQILGLALFSIQQTDLTTFSQDRRGVGYVTNPNPTPTLTTNPNPNLNPNPNRINKKIEKETTLQNR